MRKKQTKSLIAAKLPRRQTSRMVQGEISMPLFRAVKPLLTKEGVKITNIIRLGFETYLLNRNPRAAKKLGVSSAASK